MLAVGNARWALDVMTLRWRPDLEASVRKLKGRLEEEFGTELRGAQRTLTVTCHVASDKHVVRALVDLARQAINSRQPQRRGGEAAQLWPWSPQLGAVDVQPWLGQSANLREEILLSSGDALRKKLWGQFSRARDLGYRTCVAIDQRGPRDLMFGANSLPLPDTVAAAVEQVEATVGSSFDIVILIGYGDRVHWIRR